MNALNKVEVLVVGAGPVGLYLALQLAESGVRVAVIDREQGINAHSYALALHPKTQKLLSDGDALHLNPADGLQVRRVRILDAGQERAVLDYGALETPYPHIAVIPQNALEGALERRLKSKGVSVHWEHELTGIEPREDGVVASVQQYGFVPQGYPILEMQRLVVAQKQWRAEYVIGADGYHSAVRTLSGLGYEPRGAAKHYSVYEFATDQRLGSDARIVVLSDSVSALWPLKGGRCRWAFSIADAGQHRPDFAGLRQLLSERAPWFDTMPDALDWVACVRFEPRLADRFGDGRVWLAGDSAHLTSPIGVQSMNMGLAEASELSVRLSEILQEGVSPASLETYSRERVAEWNSLLDTAAWEAGPECEPWVRDHAGMLVPLVPATGRELAELLGRLGIRRTCEQPA